MKITAKYMMALCPPVRTVSARSRFLAGDSSAAFAAEIFEKYSGIFTDEMTYPSLVFLNKIANDDSSASMARISLAVRLLLMKFKLIKENKLPVGLSTNLSSVINKSYESTMAGIRIESPKYFAALTALSNAVDSGLNSGKKFIEIIYNSLEKLAKEKTYSDTAIGKTLMVFVRETGSAGRNFDFSEIERTVEEFFSETKAEYSESERIFQDLRFEAHSGKSEEVFPKNEAAHVGKGSEFDENYEIKFIKVPLSERTDLRAQIDIDDFLGKETIRWLSDEPGGIRSAKPVEISYNVKQANLTLSGKNFTRRLIALNSAEKPLRGGEKFFARDSRLDRFFETAEKTEKSFVAAAIVERKNKQTIIASERLVERIEALGAVDRIDKFASIIRSGKRLFTRESRLDRALETAERTEKSFVTVSIVERFKALRSIARTERFGLIFRDRERFFARESRLDRALETAEKSEKNFFTAALVERFNAIGKIDRIERFFARERQSEQNFFAASLVEQENRVSNSERLIERIKALGAVDRTERFGSIIRDRERFFTWENRLDRALETAERTEKSFLTTAIIERFKALESVDRTEKFGSIVRDRERFFARESRFDRAIETAEKTEKSFLTSALVERDSKQINDASERFVERIKAFGWIEKYSSIVRNRDRFFSRERQLDRALETAERTEKSFLTTAIIERFKALESVDRTEKFVSIVRDRERFFARESWLDRALETAEKTEKSFLTAALVKRDNKQTINASERLVERIKSIGKTEKLSLIIRDRESFFAQERLLDSFFEKAEKTEKDFFNVALFERFKALGAVDRIDKFASIIRNRERFFARDSRLDRVLETAERTEKSFLTAALVERFNAIGKIDRIERFFARERQSEQNFFAASLVEHEHRVNHSECLIERIKALVAVDRIERFVSIIRDREMFFARESQLDRALETAERTEKSFLTAALVERFKALESVDRTEKFVSIVRDRERFFARESWLDRALETAEKTEKSFLTAALVKRDNKQTINASERLVERIKSIGKTEKLSLIIRDRESFFAQERLLDSFFEKAEKTEKDFFNVALFERFKALGAVDRIERFASIIRNRERFFARERELDKVLETGEKTEKRFLTAALVERDNIQTINASERLIERIKVLVGTRKFGLIIRDRESFFARERLLDSFFEKAEKTEKDFFNVALVERFKTLGAVDRIEKFSSIVRDREKRLERVFEGSEKYEKDFIATALIERNNEHTVSVFGRVIERFKVLGAFDRIEKFSSIFRDKERQFEKALETAEKSEKRFLAVKLVERNNEHAIGTSDRLVERIKTLGTVGRNDYFHSLNKIDKGYLAKHEFFEENSFTYGKFVDLNFKNEYQSVERKSQPITQNELVEKYGNLIDYNASKSNFAALSSGSTSKDLIETGNSELPAINKTNIERLEKRQSELEKNAISLADADRLYDNFIRKLRQQMMLEKSRFTG